MEPISIKFEEYYNFVKVRYESSFSDIGPGLDENKNINLFMMFTSLFVTS